MCVREREKGGGGEIWGEGGGGREWCKGGGGREGVNKRGRISTSQGTREGAYLPVNFALSSSTFTIPHP